MAWKMVVTWKRAQRDSSLRVNRTRPCLQQRLPGVSAAVLKPRPKAEEMALPAWFCLELLLRENIMIWELFCHETSWRR